MACTLWKGRSLRENRKNRSLKPSPHQISSKDKETRMRVFITGGAGFLGSHLAEGFLNRGDDVTVMDMAPSLKVDHLLSNPRFRYVRDSIMNMDMLENLIMQADLIYHLAAVVGVEHYVGDPYEVLNVNINGTQNVLKLAHRYNKKVVFSSTSEVYGRNTKVPFK